jgi:hypothetical protein
VKLQRRRGNRRWRLSPQIAPPIYQKLDTVSARFSHLWRHASTTLASANRVALIGYSVPPTDVHAQQLLKRAIRRNQSLQQVDVVNPDPHVATKIGLMGNLECVRWYRNMDHSSETLAEH